jgi:hypothetical protein
LSHDQEGGEIGVRDEAGITLMELVPPAGWLDRLELRMDARERELRALIWKLMTLMVGVVGVVVAAVRL